MRVLLLINAKVDRDKERDIAAGRYPRKDYLELQHALRADVIDLAVLQEHRWTRVARRLVGTSIAQALLAWTWSTRYDAIFADRETSGFMLAALFMLAPRRPRLTMIGHLLSPIKKQMLVRGLRLYRAIDCVIVHSSLQQRIAERNLGMWPAQVALVPYQTDERFWSPNALQAVPVKQQICSVGLEYRDYDTLIEAVTGLPIDLVIAAASYWSTHQGVANERALPPNVHVAAFDYEALRRLYAESLFVVVPLHDVPNQAGITTILEAMAMGKAVIVSHTLGQTDVVRDRRRIDRAAPGRLMQPTWARTLGASDHTAQSHTGIYVQPGNPTEMRRAITFLLEHPQQAREMGMNGRRLVEETMGLDSFTARMAALITGQPAAAKHDRDR